MTINIVPHQYQNFTIEQTIDEIIINGVCIPKGYVNATAMCKANGKRLEKYFEFSKTKPFLESLKALLNSRYPSGGERIIIVIKGGISLDSQGTWVHPSIANNLAQWISPSFSAWASEVLTAVLRGDYIALTREAQEAQSRFYEEWCKTRYSGKVTRRSLTHAIKEYALNTINPKVIKFLFIPM